MTQATDMQTVLKSLMDMKEGMGEIKGKLGEVAHETRNTSAKLDAVVANIAQIPQISEQVAAHERRIAVLEKADAERHGAMKFGNWIARTIPFGALAAAISAFVTYFLKGTHS